MSIKKMNNSMIGAAKRIMMCRPTHFDVTYSINAWTDVKKRVDTEKANIQWETLKNTIESCGAKVEVMESTNAKNNPDIVFCANAGIVRGERVYLSHFAHPERVGETKFYRKFFESQGFKLAYNPEIVHEGAGDALWCGEGMNTLVSAVGQRSDARAIRFIKKTLRNNRKDRFRVVAAKLVDPRFYHLDTCFCPLNEQFSMCFVPAFDAKSHKNIQNFTKIISIPEEDATRFACNAVVVGKNVILHNGSEKTFELLYKHGFDVHPVDMSEFIKAGGSAKCCTLRLE